MCKISTEDKKEEKKFNPFYFVSNSINSIQTKIKVFQLFRSFNFENKQFSMSVYLNFFPNISYKNYYLFVCEFVYVFLIYTYFVRYVAFLLGQE